MLTQAMINNLVAAGARRWTKNGMDRLYINSDVLVEVARQAKILEAYCWNGIISNRYGRELRAAKTYIDATDGSLHTTDRLCKAAAEIMIQQAAPKTGYDRREIMTRAHALRKTCNISMRDALKMSWAIAKGNTAVAA